jgi:hypothetical protein
MKKGTIMIWHWAHKRNNNNDCGASESKWHLAMKEAYLKFNGWTVEHPVKVQQWDATWDNDLRELVAQRWIEKKFIIDAYCKYTKKAREFVHSLSPYYINKHNQLQWNGYDVLWIFDGNEFLSAHARQTSDHKGMRKFLKPKAYETAYNLKNVLVYLNDKL